MGDKVLVIGSANLDVKGRLLGPPIAGSSNAAEIRTSHGGVARNVAENLARLGAPVMLLTAVGDDTVGEDLLRHAEDTGVDVSRALRVPGEASGIYLAALDTTGDLALGLDDLRIVERISSAYLEAQADAFDEADMIVLDMNLGEAERILQVNYLGTVACCQAFGRMMKSAASRTAMGDAVSLVTANIRICPMIELTGPICGVVFGGSRLCTRFSRSVTCWRFLKMSVPQANST